MRAGDRAVILWTSGTTSDPKGVVHTHQTLRAEADTIAAAHEMRPGEPLLLPMPVTHVAGLTYGILLPVTAGITAVLMDTWDPGRALELLERERVAVMISTPVFMRTMTDHPHFAATDLSTLRLFSLGGAGVAPAMVRDGARVISVAGASAPTARPNTRRSPRVCSATTPNATPAPTAGSSTAPSCASSTRTRSPTSRPASSESFCARGPEMFVGYLDSGLDADAFVAGGWFRTGDLARYDGTHLTIVDRLKDVIIRGGENVSRRRSKHCSSPIRASPKRHASPHPTR